MRIQTNTAANSALGYMRSNNTATERSIQKLSSGFRINRAADDAAGLAIANKLRNDGKALQQAQRNASQANAMLQTADGGIQTVANILDRMKELASQAASDNVGVGSSTSQRDKLDKEFQALNNEIERLTETTQYQGIKLLKGTGGGSVGVDTANSTALTTKGSDVTEVLISGSAAAGKTWTISSDQDANGVVSITDGTDTFKALAKDGAQTIEFKEAGISIKTAAGFKIGDGTDPASFDTLDVRTVASGGGTPLTVLVGATGQQAGHDALEIRLPAISKLTASLTNLSNAQSAMTALDTALNTVNDFIGELGSTQSRVDFASQAVATTLQNTQAAESTIRDADMAFEMTQFTKNNILQQAAQSMLSQANQGTQGILQLLRG
jgi:flagellin